MGDDAAKSVVPYTASGPRPDGGRAVVSLAPPYTGAFGEYLVSQYAVLVTVLSHLSFYDLNAVRAVHSSFKKAVDILLNKRYSIQYKVINYSPWLKPAHEGHQVHLRIKPATLFAFEYMTNAIMRNPGKDFPKCDIVPTSVTTFVHVGAVAIFHPDKKNSNEVISVKSKRSKLALLYLPASVSYGVSTFTCKIYQPVQMPYVEIRDFLEADPRPIRAMIILKMGKLEGCKYVWFIVQMAYIKQNRIPFALSGGHVENVEFMSPKQITGDVLKVVVFRGDGLYCVSDHINETDPKLVKKELQTTAAMVNENVGKLNVNKTFIMMFQCIDRNESPDNEHIAALYPNIPIFGVQSSSQYGHQTYKFSEIIRTKSRELIALSHILKTTYIIISIL